MIQNCQNQNPKMYDMHGLWLQFNDDDKMVLYFAIHDMNTQLVRTPYSPFFKNNLPNNL